MDEPLERWHGAHHYSDRVHFLFVFFLFLALGALVWSYFELSGSRFSYKKGPFPTTAPTPVTTCKPRPACLDMEPRCLIPETEDMCPPSASPTQVNVCDLEPCLSLTPIPPKPKGVFCTQDAQLCPDGTWVGRSGPNCEFKCPSQ